MISVGCELGGYWVCQTARERERGRVRQLASEVGERGAAKRGRTLGADVAHLGLLVDRLEPSRLDAVEPALALDVVLALEVGRPALVAELDAALAAQEDEGEEEGEDEEGREDDDERDEDGERLRSRGVR